MNPFEQLLSQITTIEQRLGYSFNDSSLLALAFVHRSIVNESKEVHHHNERLEFLGDSVLGLLISDYLYTILPATPEGELSYLRSRLVDAGSCYQYIQKLNIHSFLLLGRGERLNDGRGRESILADLFEAVIGAIFLDGGIASVRQFLFFHFAKDFEAIIETPQHNFKANLQDYCQKHYQQTPVYQVISESGPDHNKQFKISVSINQNEIGRGKGPSKKEAQQDAAKDAISRF